MFIGFIGGFAFTFYLGYAFVILDPVEKAAIYSFLATRFPLDFSWMLTWWIDLALLLGGFILAGIFHKLHKEAVGGPL